MLVPKYMLIFIFYLSKLTDTMLISIAYLYIQNTNMNKKSNILIRKQTKTRSNTQISVNFLDIASFKELMLSIESP